MKKKNLKKKKMGPSSGPQGSEMAASKSPSSESRTTDKGPALSADHESQSILGLSGVAAFSLPGDECVE